MNESAVRVSSPARTRRVAMVLLTLASILSGLFVLASPAQAAGDDYPYRTSVATTPDPWGLTKRQCVSFVAWRLAQAHRPVYNTAATPWGNASHWDDQARTLHKTVTATPRVGAVAQWNSNERSTWYLAGGVVGTMTAGVSGHVAWVTAVYPDGSVSIEQYNVNGSRAYSTMHVRAPRYLYL